MAQGSKQVFVADQCYTYDEANYLLTSVDLPATARVVEASPERPFLGISLRLDMRLVGELISDVDARQPQAGTTHRGLGVSPVSEQLLDAVLRLLRLVEAPRDIPALVPLIEREIHYRLLTGQHAPRLRSLAIHNSQAYRVAKAIAWLKKHFANPLYIKELAKVASMSSSSLHHHFKAITGMSPLQFQKQLRLQEARKLMLTGMDAASASHLVGYESPSHFSRDYSRVHGLSPGKDVSHHRKSAKERVPAFPVSR